MERQAKALLLAALIIADGFLTWASITAGGANAREANLFFEDTQPLVFIPLAILKALLWLGVWAMIRDHEKAPWVASGLCAVYGGLFVWNLGNLAVNL